MIEGHRFNRVLCSFIEVQQLCCPKVTSSEAVRITYEEPAAITRLEERPVPKLVAIAGRLFVFRLMLHFAIFAPHLQVDITVVKALFVPMHVAVSKRRLDKQIA